MKDKIVSINYLFFILLSLDHNNGVTLRLYPHIFNLILYTRIKISLSHRKNNNPPILIGNH